MRKRDKEYDREYHRRYLLTDSGKRKNREAAKKFYASNPGRSFRDQCKKYGISVEEYDAIKNEQGGLCAICGGFPQRTNKRINRLCIDHDHKTGKVRGLICYNCNVGLGQFEDDIDRLSAAISYLRERMV
jgi:hypothetical protein